MQISVVIPAYNAVAHIGECLESVLAQENCPSFEVVVVDDGSQDNTHALVRTNFPTVRLLRKRNGGPGSARNLGVHNAIGEIVIFIDADDIMLPGRLAYQGLFMLQNRDYGLTFGNQLCQINPNYDSNHDRGICDSEGFVEVKNAYHRLIVNGNFVSNTACAARRDVYLQIRGQPEDIYVGEDYAMNCAIARTWPIAASRRYLTWYRQGHGGNLMASKHTYRGPVMVLQNELLKHGYRLSIDEYRQALRRWCASVNMLLRWVWIEAGHQAVVAEMKSLQPLLPKRLYFKWLTLSMLPSLFGGYARSIKRWSQKVYSDTRMKS